MNLGHLVKKKQIVEVKIIQDKMWILTIPNYIQIS